MLALLLAGCALTPDAIRQVEPFRYTLLNAPADAARCIQTNVESDGLRVAAIRGNEVIVRYGGNEIVALASLAPGNGGGTNAAVHIIDVPHIGAGYQRKDFANRYVGGC